MTFLQTELLKTEVNQGLEMETLFHGHRSRGLPVSALFELRSYFILFLTISSSGGENTAAVIPNLSNWGLDFSHE